MTEIPESLKQLHPVDAFCLAFLGFHAVMGIFRGFAFQVVRLATWIGGLLLARRYSPELAVKVEQLHDGIGSTSARVLAYCLIVFGVLFAGLIVLTLSKSIIAKWKLGGYDRLLGCVLGAVKAALIVAVVMIAASALAHRFDLDAKLAGSKAAQWSAEAFAASHGLVPEDVVADYQAWLANAKQSIVPSAPFEAELPAVPPGMKLPDVPR